MSNLNCSVENCANNKSGFCCRPDIMVSGSDSNRACQTFCSNFIDRADSGASDAVDSSSPNRSLDVHCKAENCAYNHSMACTADSVEINCTNVNGGQVKTECSTFRTKG